MTHTDITSFRKHVLKRIILIDLSRSLSHALSLSRVLLLSFSHVLSLSVSVFLQEQGEVVEQDKVKTLQSQVDGVKDIMTQNVDRILARGERLDDLMGKSEDLQAGVSPTTLFFPSCVLLYCLFF